MDVMELLEWMNQYRSVLIRSMGDDDLAEDAFQETCLDLLEHPHKAEDVIDPMRYCRTVMLRFLWEWQRPEQAIEEEPVAAGTLGEVTALMQEVRHLVPAPLLPTLQAQLEGLTQEEESKRTGKGQQRVSERRALLRRALEELRNG